MSKPIEDRELPGFIDAIVSDDFERFVTWVEVTPRLMLAAYAGGATRKESSVHFVSGVGQYIYSGDTALHFAAAAYRERMARRLIEAGANVRARNRRGLEPLHSAATGNPDAANWDPEAQAATIACLIRAGADPNAQNMDGATALHRAVRSRCARAVQVLLELGADVKIRNKNGSTASEMATRPTGRGGAGSAAAKQQQREILLHFGL